MKNITIHNSLEHIAVYGSFQHAFELYLHYLKPKDVKSEQVAEMKDVFRNIRFKLRNGSYLAPNIMDSAGKKSAYPFSPKFTEEELFWFKKVIKIKFKTLLKKTEVFFKKNNKEASTMFYFELFSNLRTEAAIEYLRLEFIDKNKKSLS